VCVVLTCQRCNSTAGWKIDAHAATEELLREIDHAIRTGGTIARRRVRVTSFGETLNAIVWRDAGDAEVT
jgi:hypothetical protein